MGLLLTRRRFTALAIFLFSGEVGTAATGKPDCWRSEDTIESWRWKANARSARLFTEVKLLSRDGSEISLSLTPVLMLEVLELEGKPKWMGRLLNLPHVFSIEGAEYQFMAPTEEQLRSSGTLSPPSCITLTNECLSGKIRKSTKVDDKVVAERVYNKDVSNYLFGRGRQNDVSTFVEDIKNVVESFETGSQFEISIVDEEGEITGSPGVIFQAVGSLNGFAAARKNAIAYYEDQRARDHSEKCGKKCFVTSACCEAVGLPDNCWELMALRRYRDKVLAKAEGGERKIDHYYTTAPILLRSINQRCNPQSDLLQIYFAYILPSALLAHFRLNKLAGLLYEKMIFSLCRSYGVQMAKSSSGETFNNFQ